MITLFLILVFVALLLLRVPISFALALAAIIFLPQVGYHYDSAVVEIFSGINKISLMAVPGFIFAGTLLARGGLSKNLIICLRNWIGHISGGMAIVTILACAIFSSISGSSPATAAAIGSIMIPGMIQAGYSKKYAMGLVATAGTLGILIPPSITLIMYGYVAEQQASVGDLFMAGIIPGILLTVLLIISAVLYAKKNKFGMLPKASWHERWTSTVKALPAAVLPVLILGSIYLGIVTPTESAVLACAYAIVVSLIIYREIKLSDWRSILRHTVNVTSMIFMVIAAATLFKQYLVLSQVPQQVVQWMAEADLNKFVFLLFVNLLFFILGAFLESISVVLITLPILLPLLPLFGINVYHFAIIMTVNMEIAMITPPVGLNLFVVSGIAKEPLGKVISAVVPFLLIMLIQLVVIILWPDLSLFLIE